MYWIVNSCPTGCLNPCCASCSPLLSWSSTSLNSYTATSCFQSSRMNFCMNIPVISEDLLCWILRVQQHRRASAEEGNMASSGVSLIGYMPTYHCLLKNVKIWKDLNSKRNLQHNSVREKLRAKGTSYFLCSKRLYKITFRRLIRSFKIFCSWISGYGIWMQLTFKIRS